MFCHMQRYLLVIIMLVGICHNGIAQDTASEPVRNDGNVGPIVFLPPHLPYATELLHRYNANLDNPNLRVPLTEQLLHDGKRGLHAWLKTNPDLSIFGVETHYPIYTDASKQNGVYLLKLPPDENTNLSIVLQERLNRFIQFSCQADGFPIPRQNKVSANDYHKTTEQSFAEYIYLAVIAVLLLIIFIQSKRA